MARADTMRGNSPLKLHQVASIAASIAVVYLISTHHAALQAYFKK